MRKLVDPKLANVRTGDLTVHEGNHAAPISNSSRKLSSTFRPNCGSASASACEVASLTALERNTASRNGKQDNRRVFMVGRGGEESMCRGGQEMVMDLLIDPSFERHFRTGRRKEEERNRCLHDYFACSENSIVGLLYIVIEDYADDGKNWMMLIDAKYNTCNPNTCAFWVLLIFGGGYLGCRGSQDELHMKTGEGN
jgi:hypothetical protein